ncbi:MAG: exo-alpha-sialidase [Victivallaceae bacterium]
MASQIPALRANREELNRVDLAVEIGRTGPDYVVYAPKHADGLDFDAGNEQPMIFDAPGGVLMAVWTQSSYEGAGDHRIMLSRSFDAGRSWDGPRMLAGSPRPGAEEKQASWGFPLISKSGRIYVIYNQFTGRIDYHHQMTGEMVGIYSDDGGGSWSAPAMMAAPRSRCYDHPDRSCPPNWIIWQRPERDPAGHYYAGMTRWVSPEVARRVAGEAKGFHNDECVVEFIRFLNLDDDPELPDLRYQLINADRQALRIPYWRDPAVSVAQEPSVVFLPDGRYFAVMRSMTGYIWYSVSVDGNRWCPPRPLRRSDYGEVIRAPLCCTPVYRLHDGRFILIHQDNNAGIGIADPPLVTPESRHPACIALGEFRPGADQPIFFSESKPLMDNDGVKLGPLQRLDCGVYPSLTWTGGCDVLWHPDRKFFILGKKIDQSVLAGLAVPL